MNRLKFGTAGLIVLGVASIPAACVTINVYFPAAAAEKAADQIIEEVWGEDAGKAPKTGTSGGLPSAPFERLASTLLDVVFPPAHAQQANIDISTPAIGKITAAMQARHAQLTRFYDDGAIGLTDNGLVAIRDPKSVPLNARQTLNRLVAEDNADREALYREIARANGHPEWEPEIRQTFARRWIDLAKPGWWYQAGGQWRHK